MPPKLSTQNTKLEIPRHTMHASFIALTHAHQLALSVTSIQLGSNSISFSGLVPSHFSRPLSLEAILFISVHYSSNDAFPRSFPAPAPAPDHFSPHNHDKAPACSFCLFGTCDVLFSSCPPSHLCALSIVVVVVVVVITYMHTLLYFTLDLLTLTLRPPSLFLFLFLILVLVLFILPGSYIHYTSNPSNQSHIHSIFLFPYFPSTFHAHFVSRFSLHRTHDKGPCFFMLNKYIQYIVNITCAIHGIGLFFCAALPIIPVFLYVE
ncbi:hypothetical protein B0H34DRAFT_472110 [Crassisporium funariophilum]|nr:hypothetical protein B0H34DRAFT_472110 [Crassisporium funariophilum]